eukprot:4308609-Prymnesium_polylepis.1
MSVHGVLLMVGLVQTVLRCVCVCESRDRCGCAPLWSVWILPRADLLPNDKGLSPPRGGHDRARTHTHTVRVRPLAPCPPPRGRTGDDLPLAPAHVPAAPAHRPTQHPADDASTLEPPASRHRRGRVGALYARTAHTATT